MGTFILDARSFVTVDKDGVRTIHRRGAEIELSPEQEQRLRAGQPGSAFIDPSKVDDAEVELVEVAVANEASKEAEDGTPPTTPSPPRKVRPAPVADRTPDEADKAVASGPVAKPVTSTKNRTTTS